jgi:biopolymer transport protein ExbD
VRQIDYAQVGDPPVDTGLENLHRIISSSSWRVNKDGALFVENQPITEDELAVRLKSITAEKKVDVIIMGDEGTEYQKIVKAMDVVRGAGVTSVALATSGK